MSCRLRRSDKERLEFLKSFSISDQLIQHVTFKLVHVLHQRQSKYLAYLSLEPQLLAILYSSYPTGSRMYAGASYSIDKHTLRLTGKFAKAVVRPYSLKIVNSFRDPCTWFLAYVAMCMRKSPDTNQVKITKWRVKSPGATGAILLRFLDSTSFSEMLDSLVNSPRRSGLKVPKLKEELKPVVCWGVSS